jgi:hypothetical protein
VKVAVVALGPDVLVGRAADELRGDPDPVPLPQDGALDEGIDAQLLRDVFQRLLFAPVLHDGGPRRDAEDSQFRDFRDERVVHSVHEVVLGGVVHQVFERQDGERFQGG